ncbi:MAG TPA: phospholipid scramblase-related protein [Flavobacterium sp.]|nr:phospholipid scramblase-related protein [Flavobacterium sp.]
MLSGFFETDSYFIDEKVNMFKFENSYQVYNDIGVNIGVVAQKMSAGDKALRLLLNKSMLPFLLEIRNADGGLEASLRRGWTFWMSKITITDKDGHPIGYIKQKFKLLKPTFLIYDTNDTLVGKISGDWKAWNFKITDDNDNQIGAISKKWAGAVKEIFTSADKYNVTINPDYPENKNKMIILAGAITIDMVLKEKK